MRIDLNADVGESFGVYRLGSDTGIMPHITSASVACGFHAGDPGVMRETMALARLNGVAVGVHPGYPDLVGFGRRPMKATVREIEDMVVYQIGAAAATAAAQGIHLQHVKAHGALYTAAAEDRGIADAIARAVAAVDRSLIVFGPPNSQLLRAGDHATLRTAVEAFADRAYDSRGQLVGREQGGAVLHDPSVVAARVVRMVREQVIIAIDGSVLSMRADTICVHGDTPGAADLAAEMRRALIEAGVAVMAVGARG
jgi:UPF0271 protein